MIHKRCGKYYWRIGELGNWGIEELENLKITDL